VYAGNDGSFELTVKKRGNNRGIGRLFRCLFSGVISRKEVAVAMGVARAIDPGWRGFTLEEAVEKEPSTRARAELQKAISSDPKPPVADLARREPAVGILITLTGRLILCSDAKSPERAP
jgi:hypothetical protein